MNILLFYDIDLIFVTVAYSYGTGHCGIASFVEKINAFEYLKVLTFFFRVFLHVPIYIFRNVEILEIMVPIILLKMDHMKHKVK